MSTFVYLTAAVLASGESYSMGEYPKPSPGDRGIPERDARRGRPASRRELPQLCPWAAVTRREETETPTLVPCARWHLFPSNIQNPAPARSLRRARAGSSTERNGGSLPASGLIQQARNHIFGGLAVLFGPTAPALGPCGQIPSPIEGTVVDRWASPFPHVAGLRLHLKGPKSPIGG